MAPEDPSSEIHPSQDVTRNVTPEPKLESPMKLSEPPVEEEKPVLVTWDGPNDPANPANWPKARRWKVFILCCLLTVNVTFASSAPTVVSPFIVAEFGVTREVSFLVTTCFLLGYVFGPLVWGPGSELYGRRNMFLISMTSYTLLHLGQALAHNIETFLVTRFLAGFFAVAPLTNCAGVIVDVLHPEEFGLSTGIFMTSVFLGPVLGPIVGGFVVTSKLGWRWVFWVMMIFAGTCTLLMIFFLPETCGPVLLQRKAQGMRKADPSSTKNIYAEHEKQDWSPRGILQRSIYRPFYMLYKEPILVLITVYLSIVYGLLYGLFQALPIIFIEIRGFSIGHAGLIFVGVGIGTTGGALLNMALTSHYPQLLKKWKGFPPPEQRLFGAMIAGPSLVVGCFWLGWTGQYSSVPWYVPAISTIVVGMSISLVFISFSAYMVDTYLMHSASAFAANTSVRSAVAAVFPLFTVQMFTKLGVNWACSLLGFVAIIMAPSPFLFYKYGSRIRQRSTFAPCVDLRIAKQLAESEKQGQV